MIDRTYFISSLALLLVAPTAAAQSSEQCETGRIASITIVRNPVFDENGNGALSTIYAAANWLHLETHEQVIRRELLFEVGDCVDPLRLSESARLLRRFRFIESASIGAARRADGTVDVVVATRDDWSLRFEPRFNLGGGVSVTGIGLAERNLGGRGSAIEFLYIDRSGRDDVGAGYFDPQLAGSRLDFGLSGVRTEPGWTVNTMLAYPFLGLVGRWAGFQDVLFSEDWHSYVVADADGETSELLLPVTHKLYELGGASRKAAGRRGRSVRQGTYGLTVSYEELDYDEGFYSDSVEAAELGLLEGAADSVAGVLRRRESLRLNLVVGVEGLKYVQRRGVSTLRSEEDIAIGATIDLVVGLAAKALGTTDAHLLLGADLYGGARVRGNWFSLVRMNGEARRDYDARRWRDIFAAVEWTNFWFLNSRNITEIAGRFSAGWETSVPFQLTLGGPWGLVGYAADRYPGGARLALSVENRHNLTSLARLVDVGSAVFFDVGQIWANDAVFGVDSGLRASAGLGLRLATPTGSQTTYRLQAAMPIEAGVSASDIVFTLRVDRLLRVESRPTDLQLDRSRDPAIRSISRYLK